MTMRRCRLVPGCAGPIAALVVVAVLLIPQVLCSQSVPAVGKPKVVGSWCPKCNKYFGVNNGRMPSACPHCGLSFVEKNSPVSPAQGALPWHIKPSVRSVPADGRLYYDGEITRGGIQPRHFDPDGLAARAEAWGREMEQVDEQLRRNQTARQQAFEKDRDALLKKPDSGSAMQQLKNVFADDPDVVDLRQLGESSGTPDLLRKTGPNTTVPQDLASHGKPQAGVLVEDWPCLNSPISMDYELHCTKVAEYRAFVGEQQQSYIRESLLERFAERLGLERVKDRFDDAKENYTQIAERNGKLLEETFDLAGRISRGQHVDPKEADNLLNESVAGYTKMALKRIKASVKTGISAGLDTGRAESGPAIPVRPLNDVSKHPDTDRLYIGNWLYKETPP